MQFHYFNNQEKYQYAVIPYIFEYESAGSYMFFKYISEKVLGRL